MLSGRLLLYHVTYLSGFRGISNIRRCRNSRIFYWLCYSAGNCLLFAVDRRTTKQVLATTEKPLTSELVVFIIHKNTQRHTITHNTTQYHTGKILKYSMCQTYSYTTERGSRKKYCGALRGQYPLPSEIEAPKKHTLIVALMLSQKKEFLKKVCHRYGPITLLWQCFYFWDTDFIRSWLLLLFVRFHIVFPCVFIHFYFAFSYTSSMRFHKMPNWGARVAWVSGCPRPSRLGEEVGASWVPQQGPLQSPGWKRILTYFEGHRTLPFPPIFRCCECVSVSCHILGQGRGLGAIATPAPT